MTARVHLRQALGPSEVKWPTNAKTSVAQVFDSRRDRSIVSGPNVVAIQRASGHAIWPVTRMSPAQKAERETHSQGRAASNCF